jgi:hypothetical protein
MMKHIYSERKTSVLFLCPAFFQVLCCLRNGFYELFETLKRMRKISTRGENAE